MKEYKYTINGTKYEVAIGDIVDNIASVTVNGEEFKVEMEKEAEPEKKKVVVQPAAAAPKAEAAAKSAGPVDAKNAIKAPAFFSSIISVSRENPGSSLDSSKKSLCSSLFIRLKRDPSSSHPSKLGSIISS